MIAALIIVFREVLEAGLIIGVVLAATEGLKGRAWWISGGVLAGVAGSGLIALFAGEIARLFDGSGQDVLNAAILSIAAAMLVWTVVWMASHGRAMASEMKSVGRDVASGRKPLAALALVVGMAVLREGAEVVLLLFGLLASGGESALDVALGAGAGLLGGALVSFALYFGLLAIPVKSLFRVTAALIALLAAGLASQAVGILQDTGFIQSLSDPVWDTSAMLDQSSPLGRVLHTLVGYSAQPTGMQVIAYLGVLALIGVLSALVNARMAAAAAARAPASPPSPASGAKV